MPASQSKLFLIHSECTSALSLNILAFPFMTKRLLGLGFAISPNTRAISTKTSESHFVAPIISLSVVKSELPSLMHWRVHWYAWYLARRIYFAIWNTWISKCMSLLCLCLLGGLRNYLQLTHHSIRKIAKGQSWNRLGMPASQSELIIIHSECTSASSLNVLAFPFVTKRLLGLGLPISPDSCANLTETSDSHFLPLISLCVVKSELPILIH